jgi:phosphate transport system substrate-binding protein
VTTTDVRERLRVRAAGALYGVVADAAAAWNENPAPSDAGVWSPASYGLDTDARLADYFASRRGVEPTDVRARPPIHVDVAHDDRESIATSLAAGRVDVGGTDRAESGALLADQWADPPTVAHRIALGGDAFLVSQAVAEGGVTALAPSTVRDLYAGRITNWRSVGGPDREISAVTGAEGEPPRPVRRGFLDGVDLSGLDHREAGGERRARWIRDRDDAVGDVPVGAAARWGPLDLLVDGDPVGVRDPAYPTVRPVSLHTWNGPDDAEGAFLDMLRSPVGQRAFVGDGERATLLSLPGSESG